MLNKSITPESVFTIMHEVIAKNSDKISKISQLINVYAYKIWGWDIPSSFYHQEFLAKLKEIGMLKAFYLELLKL